MRLPESVYNIARVYKKHGFECYLVGGAVRDMLLKRKLQDFDLATNATPEQTRRIFKSVIPTGIKHGTVTVLFKKDKFEVTTFRVEDKYSDSRRPDSVKYISSIYEDLQRRDFTINSIAFDLLKKKYIDPYGGKADLKKKVIRAIGNPLDRFNEDGLRPLRACRFAAQLKYSIETNTKEAMIKTKDNIKTISKERIRDELIKIIQSDYLVYGFEVLRDTGLLEIILPELSDCIGVSQRELHCFDVFYHSIYSCMAAPKDNLILRLSALFHDIGKPSVMGKKADGLLTFYDHEKTSCRMTNAILKRLKFPNAIISQTTHLIKHHMFHYEDEWSDAAVRRFICRVGVKHIKDLIELRKADSYGRCLKQENHTALLHLIDRINLFLEQETALSVKDLKVNGDDIMQHLSLKQGPVIGVILQFLLESVLDDPSLNNRKRLLALAAEFYKYRVNVHKE